HATSGSSSLSSLFSATYEFHEADGLVCSTAVAIVYAAEFLRWGENFHTFHLTYEANACHN
ncbi:MAG: hypothetical protein WCB94_20390, partial [Terriglobales bacterium]